MTKRQNFSKKFKATVALESLQDDKTVQDIAARHQLQPAQVSAWKQNAAERMQELFSGRLKKAEDQEGAIKELHAKIGKQAVKIDFLSQGLRL